MFTSTVPDASSWNTTSDAFELAASRNDFLISAAFDGSISPFTCTTTMPFVPESRTGTTACGWAAAPDAPAPMTRMPTPNTTQAAAAVARSRT